MIAEIGSALCDPSEKLLTDRWRRRRVSGREPGVLGTIFRTGRWRIVFTYGLFTLENLLRLAQPYVLGLAIDGLLRASRAGLGVLIVQYLVYLLLTSTRRMYDTRTFTGLYTDLAAQLVLDQRRRAVEVSQVAARSSLSREFVDFFERGIPLIVQSVASVAGSVVMLGLYDGWLVPLCLALMVPAGLLNLRYGRNVLWLSGRLHGEFEREVEVIGRSEPEEVYNHYRRVARWRIRLSDSEALSSGLMGLCMLGLIALSLIRIASVPGATPGPIFAALRYLTMFLMGLESVPMLVQQISRLVDIGQRMRGAGALAVSGECECEC
jgi:hypothetical protein